MTMAFEKNRFFIAILLGQFVHFVVKEYLCEGCGVLGGREKPRFCWCVCCVVLEVQGFFEAEFYAAFVFAEIGDAEKCVIESDEAFFFCGFCGCGDEGGFWASSACCFGGFCDYG